MLRSLLSHFTHWRNKRIWLQEMRKLKRNLNSSASAKHFDQVIADGYDHFVEQNRDAIEEGIELSRQRREIIQKRDELLRDIKRSR